MREKHDSASGPNIANKHLGMLMTAWSTMFKEPAIMTTDTAQAFGTMLWQDQIKENLTETSFDITPLPAHKWLGFTLHHYDESKGSLI